MRLVVIFGPPSVGKMTVGRAIAERSEFRLFHNHAVLEPLLEVFDYGTGPFTRLLGEFRNRVVEEAAASGTDLDPATPVSARDMARTVSRTGWTGCSGCTDTDTTPRDGSTEPDVRAHVRP